MKSKVLYADGGYLNTVNKMPMGLTDESNFIIHFEINPNDAIKKNELPYPYYKINSNTKHINGKFYFRNVFDKTKITLIALQGNKITQLSVDNNNYYSAIVFPLEKDATQVFDFNIYWDENGSEELILFPLIDALIPNLFYSGTHVGFLRIFIGKQKEYQFTSDSLLANKAEIYEDNLNPLPTPTWLNTDNVPIEIHMNEDQAYAIEQYRKLELSKIPFETKVDVLLINSAGEVKILKENIPLRPNNKQTLDLSNHLGGLNYNKKQFLLVLNNRNEEMIKDFIAVKKGFRKISTNINQIIQIYPVIKK